MDPITIALGLAQFAPTLMKFFGVGDKSVAVATSVINAAQSITGAKTPEEALEQMKADTAAQIAFRDKMATLDADMEKAYLSDVADARKRDATFIAADTRNYRADILSALAVLAVVFITWKVWTTVDANDFVKATISLVLGRFLGYLDQIFQFEFGSTRSNHTKDDTINNLSK